MTPSLPVESPASIDRDQIRLHLLATLHRVPVSGVDRPSLDGDRGVDQDYRRAVADAVLSIVEQAVEQALITRALGVPAQHASNHVQYKVVGDWGVDGATDEADARSTVAAALRDYPGCGAHAESRTVRLFDDDSEFYGPWLPLPEAL